MLKLEVTESAYTDNQVQLLDMISTFKNLGFSVLMDDFGSGYSSLNMLKDMPLDTIKVDMAFIRELAARRNHFKIHSSINERFRHGNSR